MERQTGKQTERKTDRETGSVGSERHADYLEEVTEVQLRKINQKERV